MVEYAYNLDDLFGSLSDPIRRDILKRVSINSMNVSSIARNYKISFAGVAKHLTILERAGLINKTRQGKEQIISIDPIALSVADNYLKDYRKLWEKRLDSLDKYLRSNN